MAWIKLDDHIDEHPKIAALSDSAFALLICGLAYCNRNLTDGFVPNAVGLGKLRFCEGNTSPILKELEVAAIFIPCPGGWQIHDYLEYQPTREQVLTEREAAKRRMGAIRANKNGSSPEVLPNIEGSSPSPGPGPGPVPESRIPNPEPSNVKNLAPKSRKKPRDNGADPSISQLVWTAYSEAYAERYGTDPVRNAKVNGQVALLVSRMPALDCPPVAAFYVWHNQQFYVSKGHPIGLLLADAEKLHTEWVTGKRATNKDSREQDRRQERGDMWQRLIEEAENEERQERTLQANSNSG